MFEKIESFFGGLADWIKRLFTIIEEFLTDIGVNDKKAE